MLNNRQNKKVNKKLPYYFKNSMKMFIFNKIYNNKYIYIGVFLIIVIN
jgi:hypothetical protein